jgi:5-methylcytosine-specific restriction endonuclease McrA
MKKLNNAALNQKLKSLFFEERQLTHVVLLHIIEVEARKLFLEMAYPSLFEYLVKEIGYSAASAQRRIDAARLLRQIPELGKKIEENKINLSQISTVQKLLRQKKISLEQKRILMEQIEYKSNRETQVILANELQLPIEREEKYSVQRDESVRIEMTFTKEEMNILEAAKASLSHTIPHSNYKAVLLHLAKKLNAKKMNVSTPHFTSAAEVAAHSKVVPQKTKVQIFQRDQSCQYRDPATGRVCGSHYFLQVDHIHPRWAGGTNAPDNLRILCSAHNVYRFATGKG